MKSFLAVAVAVAAAPLVASHAFAQTASEGVAQYRALLADGNPAELWEAKGEALWKKPRGPKNASLQQCDLGLGPGVVKGAFVTLPRYFNDTGRVQDLESRLMSCLQNLQGFDAAAIAKTPFGKGEQSSIESLVAWISSESAGLKFAVPQAHADERNMYEAGKRIFFFRAGPYDFACASCTVSRTSGSACKTCRTSRPPRAPVQASAAGRRTGFRAASCGACSGD